MRYNLQAGKGGNVTVKSWHSRDKKTYTGTSNFGGGNGTYNYHVPGLDQAHADQHAKARAAEMSRHAVNVTAVVVGDPNINPGMGLQLNSPIGGGLYEIDHIDHEFGMSGYVMTIVAKSIGSQ